MRQIEDSLKAYRDVKNSIDTALERGRAEGRAEGLEAGMQKGRVEVARAMLQRGMDLKTVSELTGLTEAEIESL